MLLNTCCTSVGVRVRESRRYLKVHSKGTCICVTNVRVLGIGVRGSRTKCTMTGTSSTICRNMSEYIYSMTGNATWNGICQTISIV